MSLKVKVIEHLEFELASFEAAGQHFSHYAKGFPPTGILREKKTTKNLGLFEAGTIVEIEMKEKVKKEYLRRTSIKKSKDNIKIGPERWRSTPGRDEAR